MEKILINENRSQGADLERNIESVITRSREILKAFHKYQSFRKITTEDEFRQLLKDPGGFFDQVILEGVNIKSAGGHAPNIEAVAKMYDIKRDDFRSQTRQSISLAQYLNYSGFVSFEKGAFKVNQEAVQNAKERFKVFAETLEEVELFQYWSNVCETLNSLIDLGLLGTVVIESLQRSLENRIMFSYATSRLHLNDDFITNEILKLKS